MIRCSKMKKRAQLAISLFILCSQYVFCGFFQEILNNNSKEFQSHLFSQNKIHTYLKRISTHFAALSCVAVALFISFDHWSQLENLSCCNHSYNLLQLFFIDCCLLDDLNRKKLTISFDYQNKLEFCFENCSDLLWAKLF